VANWSQHNLPALITKPGEDLAAWLGEPLPQSAQLPQTYDGPTRVIVPTAKTCTGPESAFELKVIVLSASAPRKAALFWRKLGQKRFESVPLKNVARGVYRTGLASAPAGDFEYYVEVQDARGELARFPASAPAINQTVVISPGS
jgi:hypothetical protein